MLATPFRHHRLGLALLVATAALAVPTAQSPAPQTSEQLLTRLAIETAPDGDLTPIQLEANGNALLAVYDRFRLAALAARAAIGAGHPLNPDAPPAELAVIRTVVLAFARTPMGDGPRAQSVDVIARDGKPVKKLGVLNPRDIAALLPGVKVDATTLAASFELSSLRPSDRIKIVFNSISDARFTGAIGPGQATPGTSQLSVIFKAPEQKDTAAPVVPPGFTVPAAGVDVHVEGLLDLTGQIRYARAIDGPPELRAAAVEAVGRWSYTPARMFNAPVPLVMQATVPFKR